MARRRGWTFAALGAAITIFGSTALGFFPPVPSPGEVITVVPPVKPPPAILPPIPPVPPPCRPPEKPIDKPQCTCPGPEGPQRVPEPTTLVTVLSGLGAVAGWKQLRRARAK